jgi:hypothetical protein|nr:MAG TPA: invasion associated secreted endopeptidase [Caudoviricetes sp.]
MSKTNKGLVEYCKAQLGNPYWYGCFGQVSSKSLYNNKKKQYPNQYEWACSKNQIGKRVHDCVGLIKGYLWSESSTSKPKYKGSQDVSANGMYDKCKSKGKINTMPDEPGVLVFMENHVGVYIGNGYVIEARGHAYGVVKTKLSERKWTKWGKCPWIEYSSIKVSPNKRHSYYPRYKGFSISIVDALKAVGAKDVTLSHRKKIAKANDITNYKGTASQNLKMLKLLKKGKLIKA